MNTKRLLFCFVLACTVTWSGCGGNAGPGPMMPADPCIQTIEFGCLSSARYEQEGKRIAETHRTRTDFSNQWGLGAINADQAYAHLELAQGSNTEPGAGVTVGFIDSGIDRSHPLFAGATIEETIISPTVDEWGEEFSHGTAVASVIGAQPNVGHPDAFQGVAWGADLAMFAIRPPGQASSVYEPITLTNLGPEVLTTVDLFGVALEQNVDKNVDILNLSIGLQGIIENYPEQDIRTYFGGTIATLAQMGAQDKTILVWAAGNANGLPCTPGSDNCVDESLDASSVEFFAGLVTRIEELREHSIAVVAVNEAGDIAPFSNRCGIVAEWCLAAPGVDVSVAYSSPDIGSANNPDNPDNNVILERQVITKSDGTSFAAPMVSGSLAVMKQLFRDQLPNTALVTRLFATADKSGRYANSATYGRGMLDLGSAASPVGMIGITLGKTVGSPGINLQTTSLRLGGALGDGLGQSLARQEIVAFDSLGAPFWFNLSNFTGAARGPSSLVRLRELTARNPITRQTYGRLTTFTPDRAGGAVEQDLGYGMLRFGFRERLAGAEGGHFALADNATTLMLTGSNGMAVTAFTASGFAGRSPTSGVTLSWRPFDVPVGFRAGWLAEQQTLLGTTTAGAFGRLSADAAVTGLETAFELGPWQLAADAEIGTARPRFRGGIMSRLSSLTTSAFAFKATRRLANGGLVRIALSQPLRVEGGRAALSVPIGRTKDGDVLRQPVSANLAPSGRQIDVSAQWRHSFADGNELRVEAAWIHNPGHRARVKPGVSWLAGWRFEF